MSQIRVQLLNDTGSILQVPYCQERRSSGTWRGSKWLSGQEVGREGNKGTMGGEGDIEVKILSSEFSQQTWIVNLALRLPSKGTLGKLFIFSVPFL